MDDIEYLKSCVKSIKDFPKSGILFRDITSVCENPQAFNLICRLMAEKYAGLGITKVVGSESRGFVFGSAVAVLLNSGFVLVRKPGKLPREVYSENYELEYGQNTLEIHKDALTAEDRVLIVDDLLATGGTVEATIKMVEQLGGEVVGCAFLIELEGLGGRDKLAGYDVFTLMKY